MSQNKIDYPGDLSQCKCGKFSWNEKKEAFSNSQKKFYAVCDNCLGVVDHKHIYEKMQSDKESSRVKNFKVKE